MIKLNNIKTAFARQHLDRFFNSSGEFDPQRDLAHDWLEVVRGYPQETDLARQVEIAFNLITGTTDLTYPTTQLVLDAATTGHPNAYMRLGERVALALIDIAWEEVSYNDVACIAQELKSGEMV